MSGKRRPQPITVRLSDEDVLAVLELARTSGYTRSEIIRLLVRQGLPYAGSWRKNDPAALRRPTGTA